MGVFPIDAGSVPSVPSVPSPQQGGDIDAKVQSLEQKLCQLNMEREKAIQRKDEKKQRELERQIMEIEKQIEQLRKHEERDAPAAQRTAPIPIDGGDYIDTYG